MRILFLLLSSIFSATASETPKAVFPSFFTVEYTSQWKHTNGTYSLSPDSQKITLGDGSRDHLCSTFHNDTACTQLTTNGYRYLYYPDINDCCKCCSYVNSNYLCGSPLSPRWVDNSTGNLIYIGIDTILGRECYKFDVIGLHSNENLYYQDVQTGLPCEIDARNYMRTKDQPSHDQYIFFHNSFDLYYDAETMFEVPELCQHARMCKGIVCDAGGLRMVVN